MAHGISAYLGNAWMNALGNATSFSVATPYVKLHTQDPGTAGTAHPATETTRKAVSFGAASAGVLTSDADVSWTNILGNQDATHFTCWDVDTNHSLRHIDDRRRNIHSRWRVVHNHFRHVDVHVL